MRRVEPWRHVPAAVIGGLYDAEREAWRRELAWDTSATWPALEAARRDGRAGGVVVREGERVAGWTYWVPRGAELHCGALVASDGSATGMLADAVLHAAISTSAERLVLFTAAPAPLLTETLQERGFAVDHYDYLVRPLDQPAPEVAPGTTRGWNLPDLEATAMLFKASYAADDRRPFAARGRDDDWRAYTRDLVLTDGCGRFRLSTSRAASGPGGRLDGVALVTDVGEGTAHLAQLAVRPEARGHGLARRLLADVVDAARRAGFTRLSLLVSRQNEAARALYVGAGFAPAASFLAATRAMDAVSRGDRRATPGPAAA